MLLLTLTFYSMGFSLFIFEGKKKLSLVSRAEPGQYMDGRPPGKTRLLLEEVLVKPAGGANPVVCVGSNAPV